MAKCIRKAIATNQVRYPVRLPNITVNDMLNRLQGHSIPTKENVQPEQVFDTIVTSMGVMFRPRVRKISQ